VDRQLRLALSTTDDSISGRIGKADCSAAELQPLSPRRSSAFHISGLSSFGPVFVFQRAGASKQVCVPVGLCAFC